MLHLDNASLSIDEVIVKNLPQAPKRLVSGFLEGLVTTMGAILIQVRRAHLDHLPNSRGFYLGIVGDGSLASGKLTPHALVLIDEKHDYVKPRLGKTNLVGTPQVLAPKLHETLIKELEAFHLNSRSGKSVHDSPDAIGGIQQLSKNQLDHFSITC